MKLLGMIVVLSLFSCGNRHFSKSDYTFYNRGFMLQPGAALRTNGVYVLQTIWTDENGGTIKPAKGHKFYKFFNTGQCTLVLDPNNKITTANILELLVKEAKNNNKPTLFESYYRLEGDKIVIQGIVYPVKQFEYKYGYVANDEIIIVKATREGNGDFDDAFFTTYYKESYIFMPLKGADALTPDW